jgi:hypothetical protein
MLATGDALSGQTIQPGSWSYYSIDTSANQPLQVSLRRTAGDPLLFLKPRGVGPVVGGVPSLEDYHSTSNASNADKTSFLLASDDAYRLVLNIPADNAGAGSYIAAVYANEGADDSPQEVAVFDLRVSTAPAAACPLSCSGYGYCMGGICHCDAAYAGPACEGRLYSLGTSGGVVGPLDLPASSWLYVSFSMRGSVIMQLTHDGAHPIVLGRRGALPTIARADAPTSPNRFDWPFSNPPAAGYDWLDSALVTVANDAWDLPFVPGGEQWYFAIYAHPSSASLEERHSGVPCSLRLTVTTRMSDGLAIRPSSFRFILLGVVLSAFA